VAGRLAGFPDLPVSLKADGAAEAAAVVAVMEILRDAGVRDLQLFAQPLQAPRVQP
jgi:biopolymer transport protein ExbD